MNILSQYKFTEEIKIDITKSIDSEFIREFVNGYKELIKEKIKKGDTFLEEVKPLKLVIKRSDYKTDEDFDLLFISYLALMKIDFPNIEIEFHFPDFIENSKSNGFIFKLSHHRVHLLIHAKKEVFKIYKNGFEFHYNRVVQSISYLPPLIINQASWKELFLRKHDNNIFRDNLRNIIISLKTDEDIKKQQRDTTYKKIVETYSEAKGRIENWNSSDLCNLYFIKAIHELYILRHLINVENNQKSNYQIGVSIIYSKEDKINTKKFKSEVFDVIESNNVFEFSNVEMYFFSLIIQNSELFKMPTTLDEMFKKINIFLSEKEKKKIQNYKENRQHEKYLKTKFIDVYVSNLERIINYTKDIVYGLEELAKNIVEHSNSNKGLGHGVISGRIYSFEKIKLLKSVSKDWLGKFEKSHKYIDINVIDSGIENVIDVYKQTLITETKELGEIKDEKLRKELTSEYTKDIKQLANYSLNNLFSYDSTLKLFHQINRTKARLGLLIFSQTILYEKEAFVSLVSNRIEDDDNQGFFIYKKDNQIIEQPNERFNAVGTNYNFIVPVNEKFIYDVKEVEIINDYSGSASSVFKELHNFSLGGAGTLPFTIRKLKTQSNFEGYDKYSKLDLLKNEIGVVNNSSDIILIDALKIQHVVENSSDWIRFLAGLQFVADYIQDIIIINMDYQLYEEVISILKIFDNLNDNSKGFWKKDRFILFFLPIKNKESNVFWFNSLLYSTSYNKFIKINEEIGLYHHNLSKLIIKNTVQPIVYVDYLDINSKLFSSSKKLLNFELLISNSDGITLFEETLKSLLNVEISSLENENT